MHAGALELHLDRTVRRHGHQLDIASVLQQGWTQRIQGTCDGLEAAAILGCLHGAKIGETPGILEARPGRFDAGVLEPDCSRPAAPRGSLCWMQITVKLFGSLREAVGAKELSVRLEEGEGLGALRALLVGRYPVLEEMSGRLRIAVNQEIRDADELLQDADEVAFLPPVSGGVQPCCTLSTEPLDVAAVVARVAGPEVGGLVSFVGCVRNASRGQRIRHLEYEAYAGMAEAEIQKIADEAGSKWPGSRVAVAHRTGHLEVGEIAVVVVAAAPHRGEAFAAARYTIDTLKERVPIWKKEVAEDGASWIEDHA